MRNYTFPETLVFNKVVTSKHFSYSTLSEESKVKKNQINTSNLLIFNRMVFNLTNKILYYKKYSYYLFVSGVRKVWKTLEISRKCKIEISA